MTKYQMIDVMDMLDQDAYKIGYDYGKLDAYRHIMTFLFENVNALEADYYEKLHSKFEGFDKPIHLRQSDFFKMAIDFTIRIREIMEKELAERGMITRMDLERYINFKGENDD